MSSASSIKQSIPFVNKAGETMPPFAIFKAKDDDIIKDGQKLYLPADKPDGEEGVYYVNGNREIENDADGETDEGHLMRVLFKPGETPVIGEEWGPVDDEWYISPDGTGFIIRGIEDTDRWPGCVQVARAGGGGCERKNIYTLSIEGAANGNTLTLPVTINSVEEDIVVDWNDTAADIVTLIAAHSEYVSGMAEAYYGQLPNEWVTFGTTDAVEIHYEGTNDLEPAENPPRVRLGLIVPGAG